MSPKIRRMSAALAALSLGAVGLSVAVPAPQAQAIPNRSKVVHMGGHYGHMVVYDINFGTGTVRHKKTLWPGQTTPKSWSVDYVVAVGEGRCSGRLIWTDPSPDRNLGTDGFVSNAKVNLKVVRGSC